jgi:hypothetical protein
MVPPVRYFATQVLVVASEVERLAASNANARRTMLVDAAK